MTAIHRTDLLPTAMNAGKEAAVRDLLHAWRRAADAVAADQWTRFFRDGGFRKNLSAAQEVAAPAYFTDHARAVHVMTRSAFT